VGSGAHKEFESREAAELWAKRCGRQFEIAQTLWANRAGANCIRKEVALVVRILRDARLWGDEEAKQLIRVRPVETDIERAMTIEEQHIFLHVASSRAEFRLIYQYSIVALQTTASTNELRALRLGDITLGDRPMIQVPRQGAKNKGRMRAIPLPTADAVWAMEGLIARAKELGSSGPSDYLFPRHKARNHYDPTKPMTGSGLKKPWDSVRKAAGMPHLRIYDLRHTGITRMAERGVPLPVTMSYAGHMTIRMQQRYTAICMAAQRGWGAAVWGDDMGGVAIRERSVATGVWATPHKPVVSESVDGYQDAQYLYRRA
jgi:integrase